MRVEVDTDDELTLRGRGSLRDRAGVLPYVYAVATAGVSAFGFARWETTGSVAFLTAAISSAIGAVWLVLAMQLPTRLVWRFDRRRRVAKVVEWMFPAVPLARYIPFDDLVVEPHLEDARRIVVGKRGDSTGCSSDVFESVEAARRIGERIAGLRTSRLR